MEALIHAHLATWIDLRRDVVNPNSDPRVGSARDNATATTILRVPSGTNSSSGMSLLITLAPIFIYAAVCSIIFFIFRRKCTRVYSPRSVVNSLGMHERTPLLPSGWFNWIKPFCRIPDTYVLNHSSLDGYLFLRYIKVLIIICGVGCCMTFPVLLPLNILGGNSSVELDLLTFGNVAEPKWLYAHAAIGILFFGFVLYMICRECIFFINLRQAYLISPHYANRISSRTVLFTCVPQHLLNEPSLRSVFGDSVSKIWILRETKDLERLVKERDQTAHRLEQAEILLIKMANSVRNQMLKKAPPPNLEASFSSADAKYIGSPTTTYHSSETKSTSDEKSSPEEKSGADEKGEAPEKSSADAVSPNALQGENGPLPDVNGSVAAQWIPAESRPNHRPLANYGRRVDSIKWTRKRLRELNILVRKLQKQYRAGKLPPMASAFVQFHTQVEAQTAFQSLCHHRPFHMRPHITGIRPDEINWDVLQMPWWERIVRRFAIQGFVAAMVVFWSLPSAAVALISQISFLTTTLPFLSFIDLLPSPILSLISGLLPVVGMSLLMSFVPILMRSCARQAGVPTAAKVELFVQNSYFVFQVVQVFIVTTLTSAASSAISSIIANPMSIRDLLAQSIPKASNFYISYFILQGLAMSGTRIVHLGSMWRFHVMKNSLRTPRAISKRWHRLRRIRWGSIYPVFTNLGVIALSYSCIAPIVLGFAFVGLAFVYTVYRYNLIFVYGSDLDCQGLHYPRALKQTLVGLYLAEFCMFGLFLCADAFGPMVMMVGMLVFTVLVHVSLNDALGPLLDNLPMTLTSQASGGGVKVDEVVDPETVADPYDSDFDPSTQSQVHHGAQQTRLIPIEGVDGAADMVSSSMTEKIMRRIDVKLGISDFINQIDFWTYWTSPDPSIQKPGMLLKWLHPEIFSDYTILRAQIAADLPDPLDDYSEAMKRDVFFPPCVRDWEGRETNEKGEVGAKKGRGLSGGELRSLWIPQDDAGVSVQEVRHCSDVVAITSRWARLDEKGRVIIDFDGGSPVVKRRVLW